MNVNENLGTLIKYLEVGRMTLADGVGEGGGKETYVVTA